MGPASNGAVPARGRVAAFVLVLAAGTAAAVVTLITSGVDPPGRESWPALGALALVLVAAEFLFVRFRYGGEVNALNLFEAGLAPLVWAFSPIAVIATVAGAQVAGNILRRNDPFKAAFNATQWTLAAAAAVATIRWIGPAPGVTLGGIISVLTALIVVTIVNQTCFALVIAIANRESPRSVLRGLSDAILPGWVVGFVLNSAVGVLFVLAYDAHPASVVLYPVPLVVLHLAYRGYAGARSDRMRLAGLHKAAQLLAESFDPEQAIDPFLREVARSFEARSASLVLRTGRDYTVHRAGAGIAASIEPIESLMAARPAGRVAIRDGNEAAAALAQAGYRDCLSAPLPSEAGAVGALMVFDQVGLEGFEDGEVVVMEALARETASVLAKGRLLTAILDERQSLAEIVGSTSDGIFTMDEAGRIRSWNPAMERITGIKTADATGRAGVFAALVARTAAGDPVDPGRWTRTLPPSEFIITAGNAVRRLACSFGESGGDGGRRRLIAVVRDATTDDEISFLRREFDQLTQAQEHQRQVVEQLQRAVVPPRPDVEGVQLGLRYESSEEASPTGGDLFDWQVLPSGDVHVVVVDVLGHGVAATNDAVSVVHALRTLAVDGCPLGEMIGRADHLLRQLNPDIVATVLLARIEPLTGRTLLAGGGHPPALHVSADGRVRQIPAPGGAIGWPHAGSVGVAEAHLTAGESLILYTDGLIEGTKDVLAGEDALMEHARALATLPAQEIAAGLIERTLGSGDRRDDSLALVVRIPPPVERFSIEAGPGAPAAHDARRRAMRFLEGAGVAREAIADVQIVLGELLANAAVVARERVRLSVMVEPASIIVEVEDDGPGDPRLATRGYDAVTSDVDAGRGLFIVRALASSLTFLSTSAGTVVRAVLVRESRGAPGRRVRDAGYA